MLEFLVNNVKGVDVKGVAQKSIDSLGEVVGEVVGDLLTEALDLGISLHYTTFHDIHYGICQSGTTAQLCP
jgi:hypothetical protein